MFGKKKPRVLVAGAGPAGLLAAYYLEKSGIQTEIVDRSWRTAQRSYATALHGGSLELLAELGLVSGLHGHEVASMLFYDGNEFAAELKLGGDSLAFPHLLIVSQSTLEEMLVSRLESEFGRKVKWNHRVSATSATTNAVKVELEQLGKESSGYAAQHTDWSIERTLEHEYEFVIGADGHQSQVRRSMGARWTELGPPAVFAVFELNAAAEPDAKLRVVFEGGRVNVLWPVAGDRWRWAFEVAAETQTDDREKARLSFEPNEDRIDSAQRELAKLVAERARWFEGWGGEVVWTTKIRFERRIAEPFGRDRRWLVGDAAHVTTPIGVQSMNRGLREAAELGWRVPEFLREGEPRILESYGLENSELWRRQEGVGNALRAGSTTPPWAVKHLSKLAGTIPATGVALDRVLSRLDITNQ